MSAPLTLPPDVVLIDHDLSKAPAQVVAEYRAEGYAAFLLTSPTTGQPVAARRTGAC